MPLNKQTSLGAREGDSISDGVLIGARYGDFANGRGLRWATPETGGKTGHFASVG